MSYETLTRNTSMKNLLRKLVPLLVVLTLVAGCKPAREGTSTAAPPTPAAPTLTKVRFAVSPFQDTLLPIVGREFGWYKQEGLDVDFRVLGWTEVMEALSARQVDVAINNDTSIISTHERNPNLVYYYALNPFDNGFALMVRPNGPFKTLQQMERTVPNHED